MTAQNKHGAALGGALGWQRAEWTAQGVRDGDTGYNPYPAVWASFGNDIGERGIRTRTAAAGNIHYTHADQETASGRRFGLVGATGNQYHPPVYSPTSYVYGTGARPVQPSFWLSGIQMPDWDEAN